jgi:uncharacterized protein
VRTHSKLGLLLIPLVAGIAAVWGLLMVPITPLTAGWASAKDGCTRIPGTSITTCDVGEMIEMEVRDVVPLESAHTHAVVLVSKDQETVLPIFVDEGAAVAIALRLAHRPSPHPLAHDLLDKVVSELGGTVTEVRIDDVEDEIYHGRIFISQGKKHLELDARPSDSISMALTRGAKIFASKKVLAEAGISREEIDRLRQGRGVGGSGPLDPHAPTGTGPEIQL